MPKNPSELTAERLRELLSYDPETGVFLWNSRPNKRIRIGDVAGSTNSEGYILINVDGASYRAHRLAWLYVKGAWPVDQLDHINGVRSENRIANLREATNAENCQNRRLQINNNSGHQGIFWDKLRGKWRATIQINRRQIVIGRFERIEDAVTARTKEKEKHHDFQNFCRDVAGSDRGPRLSK